MDKTTVKTTFGFEVEVDERERLDLERQGLLVKDDEKPARGHRVADEKE